MPREISCTTFFISEHYACGHAHDDWTILVRLPLLKWSCTSGLSVISPCFGVMDLTHFVNGDCIWIESLLKRKYLKNMFLEEFYFTYRIKKQWYMSYFFKIKKKKNQGEEATDLLCTTKRHSSPVLFQVCLSVLKLGLKVGFVFCRSNKCF